jgi:uncharacterized protein
MSQPIYQQNAISANIGAFTAQVFAWMSFGVVTTGIISFIIVLLANQSPALYSLFALLTLPAVIIQLILVVVLSFFRTKLSGELAAVLFVIYSAFTGITVGVISASYNVSSVFMAFGISSFMFLVLAAYGSITKRDLSRIGSIAIFGLVGVILLSVVNLLLFLFNSPLFRGLDLIINYLILIIFSVLIASDANQLRSLAHEAEVSGKGTTRYAITGALNLYLDFINLFLSILRLTGSRD